MSKVLIIAEHLNGKLNSATAARVTCATADQAEVPSTCWCCPMQPDAVAAKPPQIDGVSQSTSPSPCRQRPCAGPACWRRRSRKSRAGYTHVFSPSTTFGKDVMPRVAALLDVHQVSDVMAVEDAATLQASDLCRQRHRHRESADRPAGGRHRPHRIVARDRQRRQARPSKRSRVDVALPTHTRFVELQQGRSDRPDLQSAARWFPAAVAWVRRRFSIIYSLADKIGAAVGASRAAVDAGYVPNEMQVGQTGKIISPELYMAIGISGAIQHLTGIKDAGTIVAINKDGDAPIFEIADFGLVGDLFTILPELEKALA